MDVVTAVVVLMDVVVFREIVVLVEVVVLTDVAVFVCVEGLLVINFVTVCFCFSWVAKVLVLVSLPPQKRYPRVCELVEEIELVLASLPPLQKRYPRPVVGETLLETCVDVDDDKKLVSATRPCVVGLWLGCVPSEKGRRRML
jgi:hypothetical protein